MSVEEVDSERFLDIARRVYPSFPDNDRYEGVEPLDTGATSSVWRAFDKQLRLDVAIKVFDRHNRSIDEVLDEARGSCVIRSEYVVRVTDVIGDELPAIVMELVGEFAPDGYRIGSSAFHERPRSLPEAVRWVREAAQGVHAAHLRGVSHRDLKPRNILITPISRRATVTDFGLGISRKRRGGATGDQRCIAGTPTHMAPEQALGIPVDVDMRGRVDDRQLLVAIDVFGLGALAFDLVTGNPPYSPDGVRDAYERALICDRTSLLRARTAWRRRIPRRLALIIEKAMSREPRMRYPSAQAFESDLTAWTSASPTSIDARLAAVRFLLWIRRKPYVLAISLLAISVAMLVGLMIQIERLHKQLDERSPAQTVTLVGPATDTELTH